ncbi:hypothetical protein BT96DRAFT_951598 [Gymnopus androsaceus JB14]|uniref:Uncharacterized protein n=1 Tax=Gymnopus androsaceus JB14 TaxID=1447944 RepID=A0A6A4GCK4_9AGAR|nr:hypothetical protein BT96DRAFT_951598 [Gymnopus androsaceus JB14]
MAQPSRKDALNLARSFYRYREADEDSEAEDFEKPSLDPFKGNALSQLNDYDSDSDSDTFVPPTASPAPPAVISSVSTPPAVPPASAGPLGAFSTAPVVLPSPYAAPTPSSPNHDREMEAWVAKFMPPWRNSALELNGTTCGVGLLAWNRGDEDAATAVRNALDSIKPTVPGPTLLSDRVDSAHLEDFEVGEGEELTEEQKELAEYLNKFSDSVMLEEYGIYYVRGGKESEIMQRIQRDIKRDRHPKCLVQAFPSRKQGGLYVRVRSMLDANYVLAAYFHLIDGFLYSRQPVFSVMPPTTHEIALRGKTIQGSPYEEAPYTAKLPPFWPGVWVIAKKVQHCKTTPPPDTKPSRKRAGRESSLTDEQQAIVESFFPAWEQLLRQHKLHLGKGNNSKTRDPEAVTTWINKTLKEIRGTKGFLTGMTSELTTNGQSGDGVSNNHNEHKENKRKENAGAEYQKVLMEMWEKTDQDDYNERAKGIDVNDNQKQFKEVIYSALCALCQNGQLGPCEMMILTGFRDKDNNLVAYKLQAHHNNDDHADAFPVDQDEEMALGNAWKDWCETRIPKPIMPAEELHTLRNANGIPVLGVVDLEQIAPAALTKVLSDFLHALWNHSWPQERIESAKREAEAEAAQGTGDKILTCSYFSRCHFAYKCIDPTSATHGTPIGLQEALTAPVASILSPSNASAPPLSTPVTPIGATGASTVPAASISPSKASTPPPSTPAINSERTSIAPLPTPPASTEEGVEAPQQSSGILLGGAGCGADVG